uniref:solute carrier family 22 member 23-like n=1 Tax=Doryrhamphus excisus TaxID=161450 RepID=UPI0025AE5901|nr:solute carrier family 22 member 23-like [Doryrhamphus excisus]
MQTHTGEEVLPDNKRGPSHFQSTWRGSPLELSALTHCGVDRVGGREGGGGEGGGGGGGVGRGAHCNPSFPNTTEEAATGGTAMDVVQLDTDDHQPENGFVSPESTSPSVPLTRIDGSILPFLGGFGKYQKQLIVLTWIPALVIGFSQYSDNFLLAQPNNTCIQPLANTTMTPTAATSTSSMGSNVTRSRSWASEVAQNASERAAGSHNDTGDTQCMCNAWTFELHTGLVQNVVTKWSLVCNSAWKVHIAKFSLLVGSIFGYLVFGILADWFGRHPVLIISVLFMLVFGLTVAFSVNVPMFSTLRFFEGFCLAGITLSLYVLRIELCLPGWRFSMTMVASFVMLGGQLLMPGVAYLCRDWQVLQAVIICPLLLMLSYIWIFPESLRWLLATQQYCRSKWIMGHIAKKNGVNMEHDTDNILPELQRALQRKPKKTCIVKMARTRNLWKNIVVLCVNSLTGYGIHHCFARSMMDPEAQETTMFHNFYADYYTMAGIAVASCLALCPAVGLMGRRGGLLLFMIITALASLLQLGLLNLLGKYSNHLNIDSSGTLNKNFSIAFSIIGMFSSHAVSNLSIFFCAEITPTVIRGGGLGLVLASAGFGMLTAPIMELHNQKGYFLHHIIFACCTLICIICILLLPETRYHPLPETLADDSYTRQSLLPPRKPGEQRLLLAPSESSRDYTRVHDTPLHEAAATAVSTMDSTASSAVDLTALPANPDLVEDSSSLVAPAEDDVIHASKEHLLSSTPVQKACVTDPLLEKPTEIIMASVEPLTDSVIPEISDTGLSPTQDAPPETPETKPAPLLMDPPLELDNDVDHMSMTSDPPLLEDTLEDPPSPAPPPSDPMTDEDPPPSLCEEIQLEIVDELASSPISMNDLSPPPSPLPLSSPDSAPLPPTTLPITDLVHTTAPPETLTLEPFEESNDSLDSLDSSCPIQDSGPLEPPPSLMECTVSSPIDSGVLSIRDGASTENSAINGVPSS